MVVIRCSRSWRARSRKSETLKLTNKRKKKKKEREKRGVGKLKGGWRKFRRVMAFKCETVLCRSVVLQISPVICVKRYARSIHRAKKEFHPFFFIFPSFFRSFPFYSFSLFFFFRFTSSRGWIGARESRQHHYTISLAEVLPVDRVVGGCRDSDGAGAKLPS